MKRWIFLSAVLLLSPQFCLAQRSANNSEASRVGLHGPVHTVLTESFDYADNSQGNPTGSSLVIHDPEGYLLEEYRYDPDGALHLHTTYTRKGWQIFKTETTSAIASESRTVVQSFNSDGDVTLVQTFDGSGSLINTTKNDFPSKNGGPTVSKTQGSNGAGAASRIETIDERADPKTGLSHQTTTKDGKPYIAGLVQRDSSGKPVAEVLRFADGSFNEREVKPDGATVVHKYWAPTKTHAYQTTDSHNRVVEAIDESPEVYIKTTFRYDDAGRQTEVADYDRSGNLLRKATREYQDDANGNWIEQKESVWDRTLGNKPPKLGLVTRRTITYY